MRQHSIHGFPMASRRLPFFSSCHFATYIAWTHIGLLPTFLPMEEQASRDVLKPFGKRLAELRKRMGLSQERLSLESGIARSYLGEVERGKRNLALINICRLAETLGVKPYVLLDFDGDLVIED